MSVLKLKEFRNKSKMTQKQVADALGITQAHYSRFEGGKRIPDAEQIKSLCSILNCTPNDLFGIHGVLQVAYAHMFEDEEK